MYSKTEQMLNPEQIREFLQIKRSTYERLLKEGMPVIKVGVQNRFFRSEVIEWLKDKQGDKR